MIRHINNKNKMVFTTSYENNGQFFVDVTISIYDDYDIHIENDKTVIYKINGKSFTRSDILGLLENTGSFQIGNEFVETYSERRERDGDLIINMSGLISGVDKSFDPDTFDIPQDDSRNYDVTSRNYEQDLAYDFEEVVVNDEGYEEICTVEV